MIGYHVTTPAKLARYKQSRCIYPPVRFWLFKASAEKWLKKTGRSIILEIECNQAFPLPDHQPPRHAWWTPEYVRTFKKVD